MADNDQVVKIDATTSVMEQLGKAFLELEAHNDADADDVQWSEIEEHFRHLETTIKNKFEELELREQEFKEKESETCTLLAEREAVVASKEQDLFDRIQELKDASFAVIAEARANHHQESLEPVDVGDGKETKVSSPLGDTNALPDSSEENSPSKTGENAEGVAGEVKPRPELTQFCEQMDSKGLLNYAMENQKNIHAIGVELSVALESANEPGRLVLASLEGFYPPDDAIQEGGKKDAALRGMRRSSLVFMEAMATSLARADSGADHLLNPEIKQQAKAIADEWNPRLGGAGTDAANGNSLEAEAFLQLLATFRIASEFSEEELCKLVLAVAHLRRAPELCRSLGLTHKIPGVVEDLVSRGRQIDAVHFVHAFELTGTFPPVPLLKTYLKDLRRNSQGKPGNSGAAAGARNDANAQELAALRAVIRCIKEYKLEADYPLDPLQKRVTQLERSKPDKKRTVDSGKQQQNKKQRANGGFYGYRAPVAVRSPASVPAPPPAGGGGGRQLPPVFGERAIYAGLSERYPHAGPTAYDYQTPSQSAYSQQAHEQRLYYYPQDDRVSAYAAAPAYNAAANYSSYLGSGMQSPHQQYI